MKILVFDNYDSFTYNLVHAVEKLCDYETVVYRNDQIPLERIEEFDKIILSPGPGVPRDAGILIPLIKEYANKKPIFGVCLGMQAIGEAFGGKLFNLPEVYHGVSTPVTIIRNDTIFEGIQSPFEAGRYHSWVIQKESLPAELEVTAEDPEGNIMALRHKTLDVRGVQFHPESVMTPEGEKMLLNWIKS